jgi:membrane associated rhomboid family serine protease
VFIPYQVDVPMARWPIANWVLIGLTIIISLMLFVPMSEWENDERVKDIQVVGDKIEVVWEPPDNVLHYFLLQPGNFHPFQLVGSLFAHNGILHLIGNMLFLWVFGNAINAKLGHWQYVAFYLGVGLFEGAVWMLIGPRQPALGASGAIMGVVGAMFVLYPLNEISVAYWIGWFWRGVIQVSAMWVIGLYFVMDVYGAVFAHGAGVGYLAHVAGFIAGALGAAALLWWKAIDMDRGEKSILQMWGAMPFEEEVVVPRKAPIVQRPGRLGEQPTARVGPKVVRKPRDEGPIALD